LIYERVLCDSESSIVVLYSFTFHSAALSFCFFFVSCSCAHRDLLSFPTRRSSDLMLSGGALVVAGLDLVAHLLQHPADLPAGGLDRKSTRLNSSHVSISYAVFCLKKKIDD